MKKSNKVIAFILAAVFCLSLVGCGSDKKEDGKVLRMATNAEFPPYEYYKGEEIVGIDVDIAKAIGEYLGYEVVIEDMEFKGALAAIQSGKVDFALAGITADEERKKNMDFSDTYAHSVQVIIVKEDSEIQGPDDLEGGKTVGVQEMTTSDLYATDSLGEDFVERYPKSADAVQALLTDKIDAVIVDSETAKAFVASKEGLKILETAYADEEYAIAVQKGDTEMLSMLNEAIAALKEDGTLDKIIAEYIH